MTPRNTARLAQALILAAFLGLAALLAVTTAEHLAQRGIRSGFDFLLEPAGFALGESLLAFEPEDTTLRAFAAGLANTLRVAVPGVLLALAVGVLTGFARMGDNPLVRGLASAAIDAFRNVPLLLQLL